MNEGEERAVIDKYEHLESKESIVELFRQYNILKRETGLDIIRSIIKDIDKAYNPLLVLPPEMLSHLILFLEKEEIVVKRNVFLIHPIITRRLLDYFPLWLALCERCTKEPLKRKPEFQLSNVRFFVKIFCHPKKFKLQRSRNKEVKLDGYNRFSRFPKGLIVITADVREEEERAWERERRFYSVGRGSTKTKPETCEIFRDLEYILWNQEKATFTTIRAVSQALFYGDSDSKVAGGSESIRASINGIQLFELFLWQSAKSNTLICHFEGFQELEKVLGLFRKTVVYKGSFSALGQKDFRWYSHGETEEILYRICLLFQVLVAKKEEMLHHFLDLGGETPSKIEPENVFVKKSGRTRKQRLDEFLKTEELF